LNEQQKNIAGKINLADIRNAVLFYVTYLTYYLRFICLHPYRRISYRNLIMRERETSMCFCVSSQDAVWDMFCIQQ